MARILALDLGEKRTGIAVTDDLQIIASGLTTVNTSELMNFLTKYLDVEAVCLFVIGQPKQLNNQDSQSASIVEKQVLNIKKHFPTIPIEFVDERFTSKMAFQTMIDSGLSKKQRQNKALIDKISATIILQSYLSSKG